MSKKLKNTADSDIFRLMADSQTYLATLRIRVYISIPVAQPLDRGRCQS